MSVIRVNKTSDYTVMSNYHLRDGRLTLKAKGLLSQMLSLPKDWDYTVAGLVAINQENESAIKTALAELKAGGYLVVTKIMPDKTKSGRIEYVYDIYEQPRKKQKTEKQGVENQGLVFQGVENHGQYNTDKQTTEKQNTEHKEVNKRFAPPTLEEVAAYCTERKNNVDAQRFVDYYTANGWQVGRNKMKDWRAAVRNWERNGYSSRQGQRGENGVLMDDRQTDELDGIL